MRSVRSIRCSETSMFDLIFVAAIVAFFAISIAYAYACDRL
jgi:hypothetical protein